MNGNTDPKGYYARLGVSASASSDEIKTAYRQLAKQLHPDINRNENAKAHFQAIGEAYAVLSDPELRSAYDALQYANPAPQSREEKIDPICCSRCGKVTAQPRATAFFRVVSLLFFSTRTPIQGIFCSACARIVSLQASLVSALFGWWGFPWGPIWTIGAICVNARGGKHSKDVEENLLWYNAVAFLSQGKLAISYALAQQVRKARDTEIGLRAAKLMDHLRASGVPASSPGLKNPWRNPILVFAHLALLGLIPGIFGSIFAYEEYSKSLRQAYRSASQPTSKLDFSQYATPASPTSQVVIETCAFQPDNGKVLVRNIPWTENGHSIEVRNGTDGNAIVKVRDANSGSVKLSFFVARGGTASFSELPDGVYRIQYAFGRELASDCISFTRLTYAGQFPTTRSLTTERTATHVIKKTLTYTLYSAPGGNVRPETIDSSLFNLN